VESHSTADEVKERLRNSAREANVGMMQALLYRKSDIDTVKKRELVFGVGKEEIPIHPHGYK
jgi:hypothetical protein